MSRSAHIPDHFRPLGEQPAASPARSTRGTRLSSADPGPESGAVAPPAVKTRPEEATSLETIAAQVVDLIRPEDAYPLWLRHHEGEENVFSSALYDGEGQRIFAALRARRSEDSDFRRTVEHYTAEFERLISALPQTREGEDARRHYFGSEAGRVYLVLAHALGRLE